MSNATQQSAWRQPNTSQNRTDPHQGFSSSGRESCIHSWFSLSLTIAQRYSILSELPKTPEEIQSVVDLLYEGMVKRENEAVVKLRGVIKFATTDDCELILNWKLGK